MQLLDTLEKSRQKVLEVIQNPILTHGQTVIQLAKTAENILPYPSNIPEEFYQYYDEGLICDVSEGHAPYAPRYIVPDYSIFMSKGCGHLRLEPPKDLYEAINGLLILYRSVPSVTHFPVYMGEIDTLLEPFIEDENEAKKLIKGFLIHCDRTFGSSFCHMNLGPRETKAGRIILELEKELKNAIPNMTLLYDPEITNDDYAQLAIEAALASANPAFAYKPMYDRDFKQRPFGIVSCYNGLPIGGGAFTLSRIRLNKIAGKATSVTDFLVNELPKTVDVLCRFMEAKIEFLVEETPFFKHNFLVKEGFIQLDDFIGLFGMVGLAECVNQLMEYEGKSGKFGESKEANELGVLVMDTLEHCVKAFHSKYSANWDYHFMLHSQVGAEGDEGTSPGVRIPIGQEIELYDHLRQAGLYHKYFPTGVGDIFPFDSTSVNNPAAILDIFKGAFLVGMRYISTYEEDGETIRVTGYLVKKSEIERYCEGEQVVNETIAGSYNSKEFEKTFSRKVRSIQ